MTTNELTSVVNAVLQSQAKPGLSAGDVVAIVSAIIAAAALLVAWLARSDSSASAKEAQTANELSRSIARRQGIIELHMVWHGVAEINPVKPVFVDVITAVKALETTASLWFADVLEKRIILNFCWDNYQKTYESISQCSQQIPGDQRKCNELITPEMQKAYDDMAFMAA